METEVEVLDTVQKLKVEAKTSKEPSSSEWIAPSPRPFFHAANRQDLHKSPAGGDSRSSDETPPTPPPLKMVFEETGPTDSTEAPINHTSRSSSSVEAKRRSRKLASHILRTTAVESQLSGDLFRSGLDVPSNYLHLTTPIFDSTGQQICMGDVFGNRLCVAVFLRHFGCLVCNAIFFSLTRASTLQYSANN